MTSSSSPATEESIDFGKLSETLKRHWKLVLACSAGGLVVAGGLTARSPRIWQAQFQIVVSDESAGSGLSNLISGSGLTALLGGGGGLGVGSVVSSLDTEKTILTSPSVLLPVFEFVQRRNPKDAPRTFAAWAGAVAVKEEKKTSVLKVSYEGTDPQLVLAASQKLSQAYKGYSGRKRLRSLQSLVTYLRAQIALLQPKALASRKAAEAFANRYTLSQADSVPNSGGGAANLSGDLSSLLGGVISSSSGSSAGSLKVQETALNKQILELRYQLARVRRAGDREPIQYSRNQGGVLGSLVGVLPNTGSLQELDRLIAERRSRLNDNDPTITSLLRQRQVLVGSMNRQLAKELENAIQLAQVQLASLKRPEGVIERFQQLSKDANREEALLTALENKLAEQELELARDSQPWELISTATLLPKPVKPQPILNLGLGMLAGLIAGSSAALWRDRRSGLVHHLDELLELLPYPLLGQLNSAHSERWQGLLELLARGPLASAPQVAVVAAGELGERAQHFASELQRTLQADDPAAQVLLTNDLVVASRAQAQLLVTGLGAATSDVLKELHNDLTLQARPVAGLVLLSDPKAGDDA